jgi:biotin carboxylase
MPTRILLVSSPGGPPIDYVLPRVAARGEVYVLALKPLPQATEKLWRPYCAEVIPAHSERLEGDALTGLIAENASRIGADAICTFSEPVVIAVARAAGRLGLAGAGPNVARSRDKRLMRAIWEAADVPIPRFRPVSSEAGLRKAFRELTPPLLLKSAWGAGSVGQLIIDREEHIASAWSQTRQTVAEADRTGVLPFAEPGALGDFLVEEIIPGTTRSWWEPGSGYGDYLSVEGIVVDGVYHPICITSRLPTIPPFTEVCNVAPCVLPAQLQRRVESVARAAVDALGLETCGTHTEIKLMDGGELAVIESAARFGGAMVTAQIEHVFGYDLVGMFTDALLGLPPRLPERMLTDRDGRGASATLSLIATDAAGNPWSRELDWDENLVDWDSIVTPGTKVEAVRSVTIPNGTPMPRYDLSAGVTALGGILFLCAADAQTLVRDSHAVLNSLEHALAEGRTEKNEASARAPPGDRR